MNKQFIPMPFRPYLTDNELHEITARSQPGTDTWRLLWEIRRYQALALRFNQVMTSLGPNPRINATVAGVAQADLDEVPVVQRRRAEKPTLEPAGPGKRRAAPAPLDLDDYIPLFGPPPPPALKPKP